MDVRSELLKHNHDNFYNFNKSLLITYLPTAAVSIYMRKEFVLLNLDILIQKNLSWEKAMTDHLSWTTSSQHDLI